MDELILIAYYLLLSDSGYMLIDIAWLVAYFEEHKYN